MKKTLFLVIATVGILLAPLTAQADTFCQTHPRRAEVLQRDYNQQRAENFAYRTGQITPGQDRQLHSEDQAIRRQEQREAYRNGGYLTATQQRQLNREENGVQHQFRRDEWLDR